MEHYKEKLICLVTYCFAAFYRPLSFPSFSINHLSVYNTSGTNKHCLIIRFPISNWRKWKDTGVISDINDGSVQVSSRAGMHNTRILKLKPWNCFSFCDMLKYPLWKIGQYDLWKKDPPPSPNSILIFL